MKCTRMVDDRIMNVVVNSRLPEELQYFEYFTSHIAIYGEINEDVKFSIKEV